MKPRARRVTLAAAALGAGVLGVLMVTHWGTIRDHVEAWRFQLTRETETILPDSESKAFLNESQAERHRRVASNPLLDRQFISNAKYPGLSRETRMVPVREELLPRLLASRSALPVVTVKAGSATGVVYWLFWPLEADAIVEGMRDWGWRVLEQRCPRRAYVVTGYPTP
jgi:hypothetical protein